MLESFLNILESVLGPPGAGLPLHEPEFRGKEWDYVKECLDTGWVSSVGRFVDEFESAVAKFTGAKHAIATVNGTTALQVALKLSGVRPGDEVIVPALSFVATANAVAHAGAIPHFVDSCPETLGMDPLALKEYLSSIIENTADGIRNRNTGRRIAAVVPMHTFGHPVDLPKLLEVCETLRIPMVEDAAESLGSMIQGKMTGTFGLLGILSFNGNKVVTTGGGGAILTNDTTLAKRAKHLTTTAKVPHRWEFFHDETGFNFRLPNLNAALGCAQLEQLPDFLRRKRLLAERYRSAFSSSSYFSFSVEPKNFTSNYWLNSVKLKQASMQVRNEVLNSANSSGYHCRPAWNLLNTLPMYQQAPQSPIPVATMLESSLINLPSSPKLVVKDR